MKRSLFGLLAALAVIGGAAFGVVAARMGGPSSSPAGSVPLVAGPSPRPSTIPGAPGATPAVPPSGPVSSPTPTRTLVADPLTGELVPPAVARRHPIAVMIDDLSPARPQSGFTSASIVFHAPAEGGIPRYMMIFHDKIPGAVGPVRSSRYYYIAWAAQWRAMYVHVGGSPQALRTLAAKGRGQLVYNADELRYGGRYLWRIKTRTRPHNVYTDGKHLRQLAAVVGAKDGPIQPAWQFAPDLSRYLRPIGTRIDVGYPANHIRYMYVRATNTWRRSVTGEKSQIDSANKRRVAPKNVVIMLVRFGQLNDGHPEKHRLEGQILGSGRAWIATNGKVIRGTWRKASLTGALRFFDTRGRPVTLTVGQTFVQVMPTGSAVTIRAGHRTAASGGQGSSPIPE
jgi:hypothetical protein